MANTLTLKHIIIKTSKHFIKSRVSNLAILMTKLQKLLSLNFGNKNEFKFLFYFHMVHLVFINKL